MKQEIFCMQSRSFSMMQYQQCWLCSKTPLYPKCIGRPQASHCLSTNLPPVVVGRTELGGRKKHVCHSGCDQMGAEDLFPGSTAPEHPNTLPTERPGTGSGCPNDSHPVPWLGMLPGHLPVGSSGLGTASGCSSDVPIWMDTWQAFWGCPQTTALGPSDQVH